MRDDIDAAWPAGPVAPVARADEVHLWRIALDPAPAALVRLGASLSEEERVRAAAFRRPGDGARFIAAHGSMRAILARYLGVEPQTVRFRVGAHGKPALADVPLPAVDGSCADLRFNLAHAGGIALVAVACGREVGVDLEPVRPMRDADAIAERWFAREERDALARCPPADATRAFFACWTRKEAFVKALGVGLALPLDTFAVTVGPDAPATLLRAPACDGAAAERWDLVALVPAPGVVGAVAAPRVGRAWRAHCWTWREE